MHGNRAGLALKRFKSVQDAFLLHRVLQILEK